MNALFILHQSPPVHGAAKVGDNIQASDLVKQSFDAEFIKITSASSVDDVGAFAFRKLALALKLLFDVIATLFTHKPDVVYYTASTEGFAFYRDVLVTLPLKLYVIFFRKKLYFHFHTKGISKFIEGSSVKHSLAKFLLWRSQLIVLSELLASEYKPLISSMNNVHILPNSVSDPWDAGVFSSFIAEKFSSRKDGVNFLFLSNMIPSKGYKCVLKLAEKTRGQSFAFHFAGGWQSKLDEEEFFKFIARNNLTDNVIYHGLVGGKDKHQLFCKADVLLFPTRYHKEAFPLTVLEAFSYGIPVITSDEASLPNIVTEDVGRVVDDLDCFTDEVLDSYGELVTEEVSKLCRQHYVDNYTLPKFEQSLVKVLKS